MVDGKPVSSSCLNFFAYLFRLRRYKAKCVKTRCLQEGLGHLEPRFQGRRGRPWGIFLVSTKLDIFCYPTVQTAPCYVCRRFNTIPACDRRTDRQTDRQTDGIAVGSTALAMRALRRAVKTFFTFLFKAPF